MLARELAHERERLQSLRRAQQATSQRRQAMQLEHETRSARLVQLRANIDAGDPERLRWREEAFECEVRLRLLPQALLLLLGYATLGAPLPLRARRRLLRRWWSCASRLQFVLPELADGTTLEADPDDDGGDDDDPLAEREVTEEIEGGGGAGGGGGGGGGGEPLLLALLRVSFGEAWAASHAHSLALPADGAAREAALLISLGARWRWPLLVDPQHAARGWLATAEASSGF